MVLEGMSSPTAPSAGSDGDFTPDRAYGGGGGGGGGGDAYPYGSSTTDPNTSGMADGDAYGADAKPVVAIDMRTLCQPCIGTTLTRLTDAPRAAFITATLRNTSAFVKRPLTQTEAQAAAEHLADMLATMAEFGAAGAALGAVTATSAVAADVASNGSNSGSNSSSSSGSSTRKFDANRFAPLGGKWGRRLFGGLGERLGLELTGGAARAAWHACGFGAYSALGLVCGLGLGLNYAALVRYVHELLDPRLGRLNRDLAGARAAGAHGARATSVGGGDAGCNGARGDGDVLGNGDGMLSDEQAGAQQAAQRASSLLLASSSAAAATYEMNKVTRFPTGFDGPDDARSGGGNPAASRGSRHPQPQQQRATLSDASETSQASSAWDLLRGGRSASDNNNNSGGGGGGGDGGSGSSRQSTWERRRREAASGRWGGKGTEAGSALPVGGGSDSFAFSATKRDHQLAKAQAQRLFDEQVERERKGEDS
jgi:hypothetical protein